MSTKLNDKVPYLHERKLTDAEQNDSHSLSHTYCIKVTQACHSPDDIRSLPFLIAVSSNCVPLLQAHFHRLELAAAARASILDTTPSESARAAPCGRLFCYGAHTLRKSETDDAQGCPMSDSELYIYDGAAR